jgi:hypothetical protein
MQRIALIASLLLASCAAYRRQEPAPAPAVVAVACAEPQAAGFGFDVIPLQFASAADLAQILGRMRLSDPGTTVLADTRTNSLIVQGPDEGRHAAADLIAKLDVRK